MFRVFLVLLAILLAVLAFVFDRTWLYAGAGVPLLGVLGLIGWQMWTRYQSHQRREDVRPGSDEPEEDLEEFGIVDVRPQTGGEADGTTAPSAASADESESARSSAEPLQDPKTSTPSSNPAPPAPDHPAVAPPEAADASDEETEPEPGADAGEDAEDAPTTDDDSALRPLLESARAALGAHTVCLLVQEDVALAYDIEACASVRSDVRTTGAFETQTPLLSARMSRQPVTVQSLDDQTRAALGYYRTPPSGLVQMAVAPLQRPDDPATIFLLADATEAVDLAASRARRLLEHYAETVDLLLDSEPTGITDADTSQDEAPADTLEATGAPDAEEEDGPPPRRTIIAEEMEAAETAGDDLALALVHLNRAESIARRGAEAVTSAERRLAARLEQEAPGRRIERFGELTYGIFLREGADEVEPWAVDLQEAIAAETGVLEGGVSVGVAVCGPSHTEPERLRSDATEALREAYETGTCTIVA